MPSVTSAKAALSAVREHIQSAYRQRGAQFFSPGPIAEAGVTSREQALVALLALASVGVLVEHSRFSCPDGHSWDDYPPQPFGNKVTCPRCDKLFESEDIGVRSRFEVGPAWHDLLFEPAGAEKKTP